jgi:membrane protease YdiL (CAAX protease family)
VTTDIDTPAPPLPNTTDATAYHRLMRTLPGYRWWRPLLVGLLAFTFYVAALIAMFVAAAIAAVVFPVFGTAMETFFADPEVIDMTDPFAFAAAMLAVIVLLPSLQLAVRLAGRGRLRSVSSVSGGLRRRWLGRCLAIAVAVFGAGYAVSFAVAALRGEAFEPRFDDPHLVTLLVLALVLVPFQAAAEEYVFRGLLMQTVGSWLKHPAFAIVLPVPLFVFGHTYDALGMIDIAAFGLVAGWLTWRTGGLEAAIALHIVNNCAIAALGAVRLVDSNAVSLGPADLLVSIGIMLGFCFAVTGAARHRLHLSTVVA